MSATPAPGPLGGRPLPDADYDRFADFLRGAVGLELHQYKQRQMERRIRSFAARLGARNLDEYVPMVRADPDELDALLDRITINVSQLFRNPEQWVRLTSEVIPDLISTGAGRIRAWSAGCSFGAEAFSLAAAIRDVAPTARLEIRASDIDRRILATAARGEFTDADARSAPSLLLERHFERTESGGWRASRDLRSTVTFRHEDLLAPVATVCTHDLVLCRNVVIYFTPEARAEVHARLAATLRPGGYLVIGSTERITQPLEDLGLETAYPFVFRKRR